MGGNAIGEVPIHDLRACLEFIRDRIVNGGPRTVDAAQGEVFHLYTDACYEESAGGLGGVLFDQYGRMLSFFSCEIKAEQAAALNPLSKKTIIFELESLAVYVGYKVLLKASDVQ